MTLQNKYLTEAAKALAEESFEAVDFSSYSNQSGGVTSSSTSLTNEIGNREEVSVSRQGTEIDYITTRSSTEVVDTSNGDDIQEIGFNSDSSGSDLQMYIDVANINQTLDFDVETTQKVIVERQ